MGRCVSLRWSGRDRPKLCHSALYCTVYSEILLPSLCSRSLQLECTPPWFTEKKVSAAHDFWRTRQMQASARLESIVPFSIFKGEKGPERGLAEYSIHTSRSLSFPSRLFCASPSLSTSSTLVFEKSSVHICSHVESKHPNRKITDKASAQDVLWHVP